MYSFCVHTAKRYRVHTRYTFTLVIFHLLRVCHLALDALHLTNHSASHLWTSVLLQRRFIPNTITLYYGNNNTILDVRCPYYRTQNRKPNTNGRLMAVILQNSTCHGRYTYFVFDTHRHTYDGQTIRRKSSPLTHDGCMHCTYENIYQWA